MSMNTTTKTTSTKQLYNNDSNKDIDDKKTTASKTRTAKICSPKALCSLSRDDCRERPKSQIMPGQSGWEGGVHCPGKQLPLTQLLLLLRPVSSTQGFLQTNRAWKQNFPIVIVLNQNHWTID